MKPLEQYASDEQAQDDWVKDPQFLKLTRDKRVRSLEVLRNEWIKAHAGAAERAGATEDDLTPHVKPMLDKILEAIGGKGIGTEAVEALVPHDTKQAMIDAAMFGVGPEAVTGMASMNALTRLATRVGIPTLAGAAGGAISRDPVGGAMSGAGRGFGEAVGGELIAGATKMGSRTLQAADFARLRGWLEPKLGVKIPDLAAFRRMFRGGDILPIAEGKYKKAATQAKRLLGPAFEVKVPVQARFGSASGAQMKGVFSSTQKMRLDDLENHLTTLEQSGWDINGDPTKGHTGRAIRDQVHQIEGDVASQMAATNKKASSMWYNARGQLRTARTLKQLFSEPGVTDKEAELGKVSFDKLQKLVSDAGPSGYKLDLQQAMGDAEQRSLSQVVHRGAKEGLEDLPGKGLLKSSAGLSSRGSIFARAQMPWPARHVGNVPFDLGRGRALSALITLGPYRLIDKISRMTEMPPEGVVPPGPPPKPRADSISIVPGSATIGGKPAGPTEQPSITPTPQPTV